MTNNRLSTLLEMEERQPGDPFLKYAIALEHLSANKDAEALKYFELLVDKFPAYVGTYLHLGKLYEKLGMLDQSIATYRKGLIAAKTANDKKALSELNEAFFLAQDE